MTQNRLLTTKSRCYCDNHYAEPSRAPQANILGDCWQPCAGNSSEVCGGSAALSVYRNCDGGACENQLFTINGTVASASNRRRHLHAHTHGR